MALQPMKSSKISDSVLQKSIPIQMTDLSTFDDSFSYLKEKFQAEMKRLDEEMTRFSVDLMNVYGQSSALAPALTSSRDSPTWETIVNSPLVQGEGESKTLKLQFDVSHFDPSEIKVQIVKNILVVSASHEEKSDSRNIIREFKREFSLPKGTDPNAVISSLSRDGVLTVQAPLAHPVGQATPLSIQSPKTAPEPEAQTPQDQVPPSPRRHSSRLAKK